MFKFLQERQNRKRAAGELYKSIVAQARHQDFYQSFGVPDTITGRFELVVLHGFLVWNRLMDEGREGHVLAQALFDVMFRDMNSALRNHGVGDLAVPHHIKRMMRGYKGRALSYAAGIRQFDRDSVPLKEALRRNLFATVTDPKTEHLGYFSAYIMTQIAGLKQQPRAHLLSGNLSWEVNNEQSEQQLQSGARMVA